MEFVVRFSNDMKQIFKGYDIKVGSKDGALRISEKIDELRLEKNCAPEEAWLYLTDILRMQVFCTTPEQAYEVFEKMVA